LNKKGEKGKIGKNVNDLTNFGLLYNLEEGKNPWGGDFNRNVFPPPSLGFAVKSIPLQKKTDLPLHQPNF